MLRRPEQEWKISVAGCSADAPRVEKVKMNQAVLLGSLIPYLRKGRDFAAHAFVVLAKLQMDSAKAWEKAAAASSMVAASSWHAQEEVKSSETSCFGDS